MKCKVCSGDMTCFGKADTGKTCWEKPFIFGKSGVLATYNICTMCRSIFTFDFDDWSSDRWGKEIYNEDYAKVDPEFASVRPQRTATWITDRLASVDEEVSLLDYGCGNGQLVQYLKDAGYAKTDGYDPIFHKVRPEETYRMVTAFEVVEHSPTPLETFSYMLSFLREHGVMMISTCLVPAQIESIGVSWWYLAPRNGPVSFISAKGLEVVAATFDLQLFSDGTFHFLIRNAPACRKLLVPLTGWGANSDAETSCYALGFWNALEMFGETPFRWTASPRDCKVAVHCESPFAPGEHIEVVVLTVAGECAPVEIVSVSDVPLTRQKQTFGGGWLFRFEFTASHDGDVLFAVETADVRTPRSLDPNSADDRQLGAAVCQPILRRHSLQ